MRGLPHALAVLRRHPLEPLAPYLLQFFYEVRHPHPSSESTYSRPKPLTLLPPDTICAPIYTLHRAKKKGRGWEAFGPVWEENILAELCLCRMSQPEPVQPPVKISGGGGSIQAAIWETPPTAATPPDTIPNRRTPSPPLPPRRRSSTSRPRAPCGGWCAPSPPSPSTPPGSPHRSLGGHHVRGTPVGFLFLSKKWLSCGWKCSNFETMGLKL